MEFLLGVIMITSQGEKKGEGEGSRSIHLLVPLSGNDIMQQKCISSEQPPLPPRMRLCARDERPKFFPLYYDVHST